MLKGTKNKWIYLAYYFRQLDQDKMRRFVRFAAEKTGRSRWSLWADAIRSVFRYNTGLIDYFLFRFYEKTPEERAAWAGTGFMYEYHLAMNPLDARDILANKIRFYEKYDQFVVHAHCTIDDLHANNEQAVKVLRHPTDKLVLKDALGQCGWGIEVISKKEFSAEQLVSHMEQKGYDLAEVFIDQHEVLQELSPSGLNTLRVITQLNDHGGVDYLGARLRITINSQVDNMASGNMAAPVDLNTGVVSGPAVFSDITKEPVHVHPISGLTIPGLQLPHWPAVLRMTKEAALLHPENRSVGWDIALTPAGPELIEGNHNWCKLLWQLPVQTGLKDVLLTYLK